MPTIDYEALDEASKALHRTLGSLDDFRPEVQNTVANIYYKFHLLRKHGFPDPLEIQSAESFANSVSEIISAHECAPDMLRTIREEAKNNKIFFSFVQQYFLDIFKYRIKNAEDKSAIRRTIERPFYRPAEIECLYEIMRRSNV